MIYSRVIKLTRVLYVFFPYICYCVSVNKDISVIFKVDTGLRSVYLVQSVFEGGGNDESNDDEPHNAMPDGDELVDDVPHVAEQNGNAQENGGQLNAVPPTEVKYICRVHSITGSLLSRWRIDDRVRIPSTWMHKFMSIERTTGNVVIPEGSGRRVLEYSADGELLHVVDVEGHLPVFKAFRLMANTAAVADNCRCKGDDLIEGERLAYLVVLSTDNADRNSNDGVKFSLRRICCTALADAATTTAEVDKITRFQLLFKVSFVMVTQISCILSS